jgi:hypothetical protein
VNAIEGEACAELDLVGGSDLLAPYKCVAWRLWSSHTEQVLFPVEVKLDWALIFVQTVTYTFHLFSTSLSVSPSPGFLIYRC